MQSNRGMSPISDAEYEPPNSSKHFKKTSNKRNPLRSQPEQTSSNQKGNGKKRVTRQSQDSLTSDDEQKAVGQKAKSGNRREKHRSPTKKSRKNHNQNGGNEVNDSDLEDLPAFGKIDTTLCESTYSNALNLSPTTGSIEEGEKLFGVLIKPIPVATFMGKFWEKKPLRVQRRFPDYYKDLISTEIIDKMLRENHVEFTKNIDITHYKNGVRETLNPPGRAMPPCKFNSLHLYVH